MSAASAITPQSSAAGGCDHQAHQGAGALTPEAEHAEWCAQQQVHEQQGLVWYFGFGSMVNPVSLRRRHIHPTRSYPGLAAGWKLRFHLTNGMANIVPEEGAVTHGVLHLLTPAMMAALAKMEATYDIQPIAVTPYDPANGAKCLPPVTATAFYVPLDRVPATASEVLPQERYIRIITAGLQHHGVDPAWVTNVTRTPSRPSRQPGSYHQLPPPFNPGPLPVWTADQLMAHRGQLPVVFAIGDRVLQLEAGNVDLGSISYGRIMMEHYTGNEVAYAIVMGLYEPLLPDCTSPEDLTQAHIAWAEDEVINTVMHELGLKLRHIAVLEPGAALEVAQARSAAAAAATAASV